MPSTPTRKAATTTTKPVTPTEKSTTAATKPVTPAKKTTTPTNKKPRTPVKSKKLTHYNVLRILRNTSPERIEQAWRAALTRMAKHGATEREKAAVQKAFEILSDPIRRKRYDARLAAIKRKRSGTGSRKSTPRKTTPSKKAKKVSVDSDGEFDAEYDEEAGSDDGESDWEMAYGDLDETGGSYMVRMEDGDEFSLEAHAEICCCNFGEDSVCVKVEYEEDH